jgi:hypothetical protein
VDKPDQAAAGQWTQVWTDAQSKAAQAVSSIGEAAFYDQGRLTFKKSNTYVTVEVIATKMDTNTQAGQSEQLEIEKRIALKALSRLE